MDDLDTNRGLRRLIYCSHLVPTTKHTSNIHVIPKKESIEFLKQLKQNVLWKYLNIINDQKLTFHNFKYILNTINMYIVLIFTLTVIWVR